MVGDCPDYTGKANGLMWTLCQAVLFDGGSGWANREARIFGYLACMGKCERQQRLYSSISRRMSRRLDMDFLLEQATDGIDLEVVALPEVGLATAVETG